VSTVEKEVADLRRHSMENAAQIRLVVKEMELSRKDLAEVLSLLKEGKRLLAVAPDDRTGPPTAEVEYVRGSQSYVREGLPTLAARGGPPPEAS
jgi:hypothetical protein